MNILRQIIGFLAIALLGAILGAAIYESVVMVPNYTADIPNSLEHFRLFMREANPGNYFRVVAPMAQISLLACVILCWKSPSARWAYLLALIALIATDVVTFTFHYPRNDFLFRAPLTQPVPELVTAAREWGVGNLGRIALLITSTLGACLGLRAVLRSDNRVSGR